MSQAESHSKEAEHEAHTGPISTPKQMLWVSVAAFVVPVFIIIGLVAYVTSGAKLAPGSDQSEQAINARLTKVGVVEVKDANAPARSGEEVYKAQCMACHDSGAAGAPKFGDAAAWGSRLGQGLEALINSALKGKGAMGAQGGGDSTDEEIAKAVVYLANAGGGKFEEPAAAATGDAAAGAIDAKALYATCAACHDSGAAGAPKFGDKAAWSARVGQGLDGLTASAIKGKGGMPANGGTSYTEEEMKAVVGYMLDAVK